MYLIVITVTQWFMYFYIVEIFFFLMITLYIIHFLLWLVLARAE